MGTRDLRLLQDFQAPVPFQGVLCLVQVWKYSVEDLLPHGRNLLKHFDLKGGGPCAATHPEPMEVFVVGDGGVESAIENHHHFLPHHLHKTYAAVFTAPFRY